MDTLNDRQKRFCDEYLVDSDATKAALRAGYSPKTARNACKWLNEGNPQKPSGKFNPEMRAYIDDRLAQLHSEKTADAQEVLEYLTSVMRGKHKEQTLVLCGDGMQEIEDIDVSARDRLKAAELIGKRYGMFKDNVELGGPIPVVISGESGAAPLGALDHIMRNPALAPLRESLGLGLDSRVMLISTEGDTSPRVWRDVCWYGRHGDELRVGE